MGIIVNLYMDSYYTTRIQWKVRVFFFSWLRWALASYELDYNFITALVGVIASQITHV